MPSCRPLCQNPCFPAKAPSLCLIPINSAQKMRAADFPCESPASCQLDGAINVAFILAAWELKTI